MANETILNGLNSQQKQAVKIYQKPCLVIAGAGCGKTLVIIRKIMWLLNEQKMSSERIAAITFTNKAANEMQTRLKKQLRPSQLKNLTIKTFHSLGLTILKKYYQEIDLTSNFSIIDSQDSHGMIKDICVELGTHESSEIKAIQLTISNLKNQNLSPSRAQDFHTEISQRFENTEHCLVVYQRYQDKLQTYNLVDFDDLLMKPLQLLQSSEVVKKEWGKRFQHVLIDEYQDTNECQYQFMLNLVKPRDENDPLPDPQFTAVGDDNQAVYEWRGANPQNLNQLKEDFANLKIVPLEQNYRSTNTILAASNHLINHNTSIVKKQLWSNLGQGDAIRLEIMNTNFDEAEKIVNTINFRCSRYGHSLSDYCILYRSNHQAEPLEKKLKQLGLKYTISGGISIFDRVEIKIFLAYLKLMINPQDNVSFLRIINTPRREIGETTIRKLKIYSEKTNLSLFEVCNSYGLRHLLDQKTCQRLEYFHSWIGEKRNQILTNLEQGINILIAEIDYSNWLTSQAKNKTTALNQIARVKSMQQWLINIKKHSPDYDLADMMHHLNLNERLESKKDDNQTGISLMTIHACKGLEFPFVYLIGMGEGSLPHHNNQHDEKSIAEERRLTYVAMTRAKTQLTLSYARSKQTSKGLVQLKPSRFLQEIPDCYLQTSTPPRTAQQKKEDRDFYMDKMRKMFK